MNKKRIYVLVSLIFLITVIVFILVLAAERSEYRTKSLKETMGINLGEVMKISLSHPTAYSGKYRTTTNKKKIRIFIDYLSQLKFQRLVGDQSAYMPMKASIIYFYEGDEITFIVPYEKETMINYKVYHVKEGIVENQFLIDFYNAIE